MTINISYWILPAIIVLISWLIQSLIQSIFKNQEIDSVVIKMCKCITWICIYAFTIMSISWMINNININIKW